MKPESTKLEIYDVSTPDGNQYLNDVLDCKGQRVKDVIHFDNKVLIQIPNISNYEYDESKELYHGLDVNIGIASAVTAGVELYVHI